MKTDSLSYRYLQELPEEFFALVGRPRSDAARYRFDAIELKDTAVRALTAFFRRPNPRMQSRCFLLSSRPTSQNGPIPIFS
jgi:Protein of unknown function (DUF2887)